MLVLPAVDPLAVLVLPAVDPLAAVVLPAVDPLAAVVVSAEATMIRTTLESTTMLHVRLGAAVAAGEFAA